MSALSKTGGMVAFVLALVAVAGAGHSAVPARVEMTLETDNWYPVPEEQMKSQVMDTALDALTQAGRLGLVADQEDSGAGELRGHLSLVGPANQVSFTLELHVPDQPSFVATSSISIEGLDREGIYQALAYIGGEVGNRMADRLGMLEEPEASPEGSEEIADLLNRGKELKREDRFEEAREAFVQVEALAGDGEWAEMARDELDYGLLMYEAQSLMNRLGDLSIGLNEKRTMATRASNRLREALAQNHRHAARVREAQNWLDQVEMAREGLENAIQAQAMNGATPVRLMLLEEYSMRGECMGGERLREMTDDSRTMRGLSLQSVNGTSSERSYELLHKETGAVVTLRCVEGEVSAEF